MPSPEPPTRSVLVVDDARAVELRGEAVNWTAWTLTQGQLADFESLACGLFWPRTGYATRSEESSASPPLPPAPALTISREAAQSVQPGDTVALKDPKGVLLGALHVTDTWAENDTWRAAGPVEAITLPVHHDFPQLRLAPWDVSARARSLGWSQWLAFYPGPVLHAGTRAALVNASSSFGAGILLLLAPPVAGQDDLSRIAQVRAVEAAARKSAGRAGAGGARTHRLPTEAAHAVATRALVARNFGASVYAIDVTTVAPDEARPRRSPRPRRSGCCRSNHGGSAPHEPPSRPRHGSRTLSSSARRPRSRFSQGWPPGRRFHVGS